MRRIVADPVVRASGLRAVAIATVLELAVHVLRFAVLLRAATPGGELDTDGLELVRTSIGLSAMTIGALWIWGTVRAARGDDGAGSGLLALSATVAFGAVAADAVLTLAPHFHSSLGADVGLTAAVVARVCRVAAQLALALALARLAWQQRRGLAMFGAAVALVVATPMIVFDPVEMALDRWQTSMAGAWWLGTVPPMLVGTGIVTAAWILPVPTAAVWRAIGRSLELIRAALAGIVVVAAGFAAALVFADADPVWLGVALTGPVALFCVAAAIGSYLASRRSIRWARWSFMGAALLFVGLVVIDLVVGALVPLGVASIAPDHVAVAELVGLALAVTAIAMLVFGCARVDAALRRPALATAVLVTVAAASAIAVVVLGDHPLLHGVALEVVLGAPSLLVVGAILMVLHLLGRGVTVAEARAFGELVRAAEFKAEQARLVHERWRAARRR